MHRPAFNLLYFRGPQLSAASDGVSGLDAAIRRYRLENGNSLGEKDEAPDSRLIQVTRHSYTIYKVCVNVCRVHVGVREFCVLISKLLQKQGKGLLAFIIEKRKHVSTRILEERTQNR
ncbi:hypothetical protein EVAR_60006_1 [Eumeta japonica]|uniref:Uncharacterized protein n=1 Tax=Eumeta variegata TaxID=151549 RepID=A0A4C1ZE51_EUMVA|nr:hypothetical protein EVAR_60006_1 [Eumeta japonica]